MLNEKLFSKKNSVKKENIIMKNKKLTVKEKENQIFFLNLKAYFLEQDNNMVAAENDAYEIVYNAKTPTQISYREYLRLKLKWRYYSDSEMAALAAYRLAKIDFNEENYEDSDCYSQYLEYHQELLNRGYDEDEVEKMIDNANPNKMFKSGELLFQDTISREEKEKAIECLNYFLNKMREFGYNAADWNYKDDVCTLSIMKFKRSEGII